MKPEEKGKQEGNNAKTEQQKGEQPKVITLTVDEANILANYLSSRPWKEVNGLMYMLESKFH